MACELEKHHWLKCYSNEGCGIVTEQSSFDVIHIWFVGTLPEYRRKGYFTSLIKAIIEENNAQWVTIHTYPTLTPIIANWIVGKGFQCIDVSDGGMKYHYEIERSDLLDQLRTAEGG